MNRRDMMLRTLAAMTGVMGGTPVLRVLPGEAPTRTASHAVFDANGTASVAALCEMIIPATDTPGAIEAGVPGFLGMMVADWYTDTERKIFLDGLLELNTWCRIEYRRGFLQCDEAQRVQALSEAERKASTYQSPMGGNSILAGMSKIVDEHTPFFTKLKDLVVIGYFSSEIGATQELAYNPMPMRYEGDYDYARTGKQWSY